jgi:hypothetical protein
MTDPGPPYIDDAPLRRIGEGLLARSLPAAEWTHRAHLLAALWLLCERPELELRRDLPGIIWRYNEASGTANTDSGGYHETITQFYLLALGSCRARLPAALPLHEQANRLLASRFAARDLPLDYWSRARLFSVQARRVWVPPDRAPFDFERIPL